MTTLAITATDADSANGTSATTKHCLRFETLEHQFPYVSEVLITSAPHVGHMENNSTDYRNHCREHLKFPGTVAMETAGAYMGMMETIERQLNERLNSATVDINEPAVLPPVPPSKEAENQSSEATAVVD